MSVTIEVPASWLDKDALRHHVKPFSAQVLVDGVALTVISVTYHRAESVSLHCLTREEVEYQRIPALDGLIRIQREAVAHLVEVMDRLGYASTEPEANEAWERVRGIVR
jgi:hypothetical protein